MPATATPPYRLISADSHVNEPPDLWTSRVPSRDARPGAAHRALRRRRRVGARGRRRPDQLRDERLRRPRPRGDGGVGPLRGHPPRRLRPGRPGRRDGARRRRRRDALPHPASRPGDRRQPRSAVPGRDDARLQRLALRVRRARARTLRRPRHAAQLRRGRRRRRGRTGPRPAGDARCRHGLLPERDPVTGARGRRRVGRPRRPRRPARHPREPLAVHAGRAQGEAARLRPVLRRPEPHDRAHLLRGLRPLPHPRRRVRRGRRRVGALRRRSRSTTTTAGSTR